MPRMKKLYRRYERWILLGLVVILLATFSITGAVNCEGPQGGTSWHMGGSYKVSPTEREEVDDADFDRIFARWTNFQEALRMPTREFRRSVMAMQPDETFKGAWAHYLAHQAAVAAGYRAGERQVTTAVEDLVGFALMFRARLPFSDVNFQKFLVDNYRGSQAEFREGVAQIVIKDQFLYPIVNAARYQVSYADAYEEWKAERERVNLQSIAIPAEPFGALARKEELSRESIGVREDLLRHIVGAAGTVRRIAARVQSEFEKTGAFPETLAGIRDFGVVPDPWGQDLRYTVADKAADVRSAGPDKAFDTADDITVDTQKQLDTHANLFDLATKIKARRVGTGAWPADLDEMLKSAGDGRLPGLPAPILDGWGRAFLFTTSAEADGKPALMSQGPDGETGTADDITTTISADEVLVGPGPALALYLEGENQDAWGRPLRVTLQRAQPPTWRVESAGGDGDFAATADNLTTGNQVEIAAFFKGVRGDYTEEARRAFETLFVHLPLVSDAAMKRLWEKYPQHRPTDEEALFQDWRAYRGDTFYKSEDPRDATDGYGAALAREVSPEATPTLVPAADVFPADLARPGGAKKDDEPKDDEPKDDEPKDDEGKDDEGKDDEGKDDDPEASDRKEYTSKGWREVVIRQQFFERLLNDILTRCRASGDAVAKAQLALTGWELAKATRERSIAAWEATWAGKEDEATEARPVAFEDPAPEVPAEVTFESVLADELGDLIASGDENTPAAIQYWKTPEPMTREAYEAKKDFGTGLQFELNRLKSDGEYNVVPAQLHARLTKALVRRIAYTPQRQLEYAEVKDKVFDRWVEGRQMERAADRLKSLQEAILKAESDLGSEADAAAKAAAAAEAIATWATAEGVTPVVENSGLYLGATPPPAVEITDAMDAATKARAERRNLIWRQGYGAVRPSRSRQDSVTAEAGSFGRQVLKDAVIDGKGTGHAYLVRVLDRVYPSKAEFSPRRYTEHLGQAVFGDRGQFARNLRDQEGRFNQSLARWLDDMEWMQAKFDLQTNSELNVLEKRQKR
ncbi:MAG: hypothetical protein O2894_11845 [Planctomycetota bacterium]|nr:hypothetical protein [Planctomycetota bacterium]